MEINNYKNTFPTIRKSITNFLYEEEANISRSKMLTIGSLMVLVGVLLFSDEVFAGHRSHSSHTSHTSGSYTKGGHVSHESHVSHVSHTSAASGASSNYVPVTEATPSPLPDTQIPQIPQDTPVVQ